MLATFIIAVPVGHAQDTHDFRKIINSKAWETTLARIKPGDIVVLPELGKITVGDRLGSGIGQTGIVFKVQHQGRVEFCTFDVYTFQKKPRFVREVAHRAQKENAPQRNNNPVQD